MQNALADGPEQLAGETPGTPRADDQGQGMLGGLGQDGHRMSAHHLVLELHLGVGLPPPGRCLREHPAGLLLRPVLISHREVRRVPGVQSAQLGAPQCRSFEGVVHGVL